MRETSKLNLRMAFIFLMILPQLLLLFLSALNADGCTKYVSQAAYESGMRFEIQLWFLSLFLGSTLILWLGGQRPFKAAGQFACLVTLFVLWKVTSFLVAFSSAASCGEAHDYPTRIGFNFANSDFMVLATAFLWFTTLFVMWRQINALRQSV